MTLRIDVFTLFPDAVRAYAGESILGRAQRQGVWSLSVHDPRDFATDPHRTVDGPPMGGGAGMVMAPGPLVACVRAVVDLPRPLFALTPGGRRFDHALAAELAQSSGFSLLCGRYEGVDQRALDLVCDDELSIGDFVLAGGELAALCVIEATVRLVPGALGNDESSRDESFSDGLLEYPQYTAPAEFEGISAPEILRSGDHGRVARWRRAQALARTLRQRPDLVASAGGLRAEDQALLEEFGG